MNERKSIFNFLSEDLEKECIDKIIAYFQDERDESIGMVAAREVLDLTLEEVSRAAYEKGIADVREVIKRKVMDLNIDIDLLTG